MNETPTEPPAAASTEIRFFSEDVMSALGRAVVEDGLASRAQIEDLQARRALTGETLDQLLLRESIVREPDVLERLSLISRIPFRAIADFRLNEEAVAKVPARAALRYRIMPVSWDGATLVLAASRVPDLPMVDSLRMLLGCALAWVLCTEADVSQSLKHFYGLGAETIGPAIEERRTEQIEIEEQDLALDSADPGVVNFVNQIISEAIRMDATDVHIEPFEEQLRLRYRVDGMLQKIPVPSGIEHLSKAIASCVKIMAQMNIAEKRKPHDGRIKVRLGQEEFDLRVSVLPTRHGETVNLRLLNRRAMFIDLENLGLLEEQKPLVEYLSSLPHGIIFITGPTGSGKTTTLYATLSRLNTDEVKIITVEDPVEYQMDGINQIQTHRQIGLTFAAALRSILRHDPDIILVGEIRDMETAQIAVQASLTGHLVFSTLHTNDAPSAVTRLIDMGVEPYLVASCMEGVVAQRLVRRICAQCQEQAEPEDVILDEIMELFPARVKEARFRHGRGCPACNFTGYRGRLALFEIMILDETLRHLISHQATANAVRRQAVENGMSTLRQSGWRRVMDGTTTVQEVLRVARRFDFDQQLRA